MQVTVSARHTEVPAALRAAAVDKIGRLARFVDGIESAEVHFDHEPTSRIADREICEVTLQGKGHHLRCKVHAPDGFVAIDRAVDKLEHQLHKVKTKSKPRHQAGDKRNNAVSIEDFDLVDSTD